jgi:hypothetical protein
MPIYNAWIRPDGRIIELEKWQHEHFASANFGISAFELMKAGWVQLTGGQFRWWVCLTATQIRAIEDLCIDNLLDMPPVEYSVYSGLEEYHLV